MSKMDAIIMAAGRGTRLRPITDTIPKPLIPVAGRGTLLRILDILPASVDRVIIIVNYLQEQIREAVGSEWNGRPVEYVVQDPLDGTGGALRQARAKIRSDRFMALYGDDIYGREDLERLASQDRAVLIHTQPAQKEMDSWEVRDGYVSTITSTQRGDIGSINIGFLLGHEWFETTPTLVPGKTDEWSIPHALPQLFDRYSYRAVEATTWFPCGTPEEIEIAERALKNRPDAIA